MRIGRQTVTGNFLAEVAQLLFAQAPFEIGTRINAWTRVSLDEEHIARMVVRGRSPEVIEAHFVERRGGCIARQVAAVLSAGAVRQHHHGDRIPADVSLDATLESAIARVFALMS